MKKHKNGMQKCTQRAADKLSSFVHLNLKRRQQQSPATSRLKQILERQSVSIGGQFVSPKTNREETVSPACQRFEWHTFRPHSSLWGVTVCNSS